MSESMEKLVDEILFNSLQIPFLTTMQINRVFFFLKSQSLLSAAGCDIVFQYNKHHTSKLKNYILK